MYILTFKATIFILELNCVDLTVVIKIIKIYRIVVNVAFRRFYNVNFAYLALGPCP